MGSFADLDLTPGMVEALASEGVETPTMLQTHAIPVLRRGNSAVLRAAPGGGVLLAYGIPLLDLVEPGGDGPGAVVLTVDRTRADALALSLASLVHDSDHRVAALGRPWALPELADILVSTPSDLERNVASARIKLTGTRVLVVDSASVLLGGEDPFAAILANLGDEVQIIVVSESLTAEIRSFADRHMKRAVFLPPEATAPEPEASAVRRGALRIREVSRNEEEAIASLVAELLEDGNEHVLLFFRSPDRAADVGDALGMRGFAAGAPGESAKPVWLGVDALEARNALDDSSSAVAVSVDVPADVDELDRRHGRWKTGGVVALHPREIPHLRRIAREAGYHLDPFPPQASPATDDATAFRERVRKILDGEDLVPHLLLLEPLLEERGSAEVAAALAILLRRGEAEPGRSASTEREHMAASPEAERFARVRLFVSVGEKDGIGPGDVLGAIVGETGISRDRVGRIDLKDTFCRVEVDAAVADRVIRALNGTSIRGRSVRADYDRGETKSRAPKRRPSSHRRGSSGS